jgi:signal transduction histidine kinase
MHPASSAGAEARLVGENAFFVPFSEAGRTRLLGAVTLTAHRAGDVLFEEDDAPDAVYLAISGSVALAKRTREGHVETLARVQPGEYFGEMGVIDNLGRSATASAETDAVVARVPGPLLMDVLRSEPSTASLHFVHRVSEYLRTTNARFIAQVLQKERMQVVGEMASSIIHDFKNPMTSIQLGAEMIDQNTDDPATRRYCELIIGQLRRMLAMAEELLAYSRGSSELQRERVTVRQFLREFEVYNEDFLRQSKVGLTLEPVDTVIEIDRTRFMRVFQNLLSNAVEACGDRGGHVTIRAAVEDSARLRFDVADTGPGIPEAIRSRVFDPFVTHGKRRGTGLGMAIARTIVEAHAGSIVFETESGKGTTFTIRIPLGS